MSRKKKKAHSASSDQKKSLPPEKQTNLQKTPDAPLLSDPEKEDRLKSDFVSTVSHELRTPLTALNEGLALVLDGVVGKVDDDALKFLSIAKNNADRLKTLINDLLDISRLEAGKLRMNRSFCDMPSLLADLPNSFQFAIRKKQICFQTEFDPYLPPALADRSRILQVLVNLVGNAVKFVKDTGHVSVRMSTTVKGNDDKRYVLTEVIDNGPGISNKELPHIFEKFHQGGRSAGPGIKGTGLGLTISRHIVELHKGEISVKSEPGRGATFMFTLPVYSEDLECQEVFEEYLDRAAEGHDTLGCMVFELENYAALAAHRSLREARSTIEMIRSILAGIIRSDDRILSYRELQLIGLFPKTDEVGLKRVSDLALARLSDKKFPWPVRIGMGISSYPGSGKTWVDLLRQAERETQTIVGVDVPVVTMGRSPAKSDEKDAA